MALTGAQFVTQLCDIVGKHAAGTAVSGAAMSDRALIWLNFGQRRLARAHNFHELDALVTSAVTVADTKSYSFTTLGMSRVKDIESIRVIDASNSRKLERWSKRKFDIKFPYPETYTTDRPSIYVRQGSSVELFKIPNDAYTLYIRYPQWATDLTAGTTSDFENKDELILATGVFEAYMALEEYTDAKIWFEKAKGLLYDSIKAEDDMDWEAVQEGFGVTQVSSEIPYFDVPMGATSLSSSMGRDYGYTA